MQGIFQKENTDKVLKYGIYRHLPTYEKIIRNLVSFWNNNRRLRDIVPKKTEACYEIISWKYIVIDSINHVVELA